MNENPDNSLNNPSVVNEIASPKVIIKSVIFILVMIAATRLSILFYGNDGQENNAGITNEVKFTPKFNEIETNAPETLKIKQNVVKHPSCPKSHMLIILEEICTDLSRKRELCSPSDFFNKNKHRIPRKNQPTSEPKVPAIVNYVVGGLLVTSLGAALIELYKAKKQVPKKNGKCPLSRKSSLADLTVMKHQRKELIRRESIMELPEESPLSKQLGSNRTSLQRRCSFPVGPNVRYFSRCGIETKHEDFIEMVGQIQISTDEIRRTSFSDSRRSSIILEGRISNDYRVVSLEGKRPSIEDSPEKRHHRLVHRH